jgi:hypothetical protein
VEEWFWLRMYGIPGPGVDWIVLFAFLVIGIVYWLSPVIGYRFERRRAIAGSLYLLVAYVGISLAHFLVMYLYILDQPTRPNREPAPLHIHFGFWIGKMVFFFAAIILFVVGLQSLRFRTDGTRGSP